MKNLTSDFKTNGKSNKKLIIKNDYIYKEKNERFLDFVFLTNILLEKKFKYVLEVENYDENYYKYKFINGLSFEKVETIDIKIILKIVKIVKAMHEIKFENDKVIIHKDLSPLNVIFDNNFDPIMIIDWDSCCLGNKYYDIAYICWLWVNFGSEEKNHLLYIDYIIKICNFLSYKLEDVKKLKREILLLIRTYKKTIKKENAFLIKWASYTQTWVYRKWKYVETEFE
ncbi:hypothetical protein CXP39_01970 [Mesoplasma syrphidae]|uniref:Aminoglycoside phosphotransferase domain-containing protein n=1 Tax=Mesoplasma syrphidae TaxID=225999 RepID=A0A2K9BYV8_9MOLU|nr:phosphotransferase [Mesoplasma syrphidae]AUF83558.1 hypothetical protein CXP39_01970 [Mesoplasma syrphidae]